MRQRAFKYTAVVCTMEIVYSTVAVCGRADTMEEVEIHYGNGVRNANCSHWRRSMLDSSMKREVNI